MQFRKFIAAALGTAAMFALTSPGLAQAVGGKEVESYPTRRADCQFTATTAKEGIDTIKLTVKGVCQEPTPGFKLTLTRVELPGTDPSTLTLALTVVPPTGIEPQHVTPTPVEYDQTFVVTMPRPTKVTIFEAASTINVSAP